MNFNSEEFNSDDVKSQLNQEISDFYENSTDILIQTL